MSFAVQLRDLPVAEVLKTLPDVSGEAVQESLAKERPGWRDFANLISPAASERLESLCQKSRALTLQRFGKVIRLFAPLYLSNECINRCLYCGFSRDNQIVRITLTPDEVLREAKVLIGEGFRNLLLVAGEHPKHISLPYLKQCVGTLHPLVAGISLEVGPMEAEDYTQLVNAGAEGLVVYQETYDPEVYAQVHLAGPKRHFDWRLETPERGYVAGFRRLGIGALHGLSDWRFEALCLAAHAAYLLRHCWKAQITISMPRLRPHAGSFQPLTHMADRDLVQLTAALRICFPEVSLVLSTREKANLRDGLVQMGITMISAGSHTEPGGYTGIAKPCQNASSSPAHGISLEGHLPADAQSKSGATAQFDIADTRSSQEVARVLQGLGLEPVWKDWDTELIGASR